MGLIGRLLGRTTRGSKKEIENESAANSSERGSTRQATETSIIAEKYKSSLPQIHQLKMNPLDDLNEYTDLMCKDNKSLFKIIKENKKKPVPPRSRSPTSKQVELKNVKLEKKLAES
jgi:hypothetical protein